MLLRALGNANLDCVNDRKGGIPVINDLDCIIHTRNHDFRHLRSVIAVDRLCTAAPDKQSAFDGHIIQRDFAICRAASDDEVTIHGQVFQLYIVGANQDAALDVLVVDSLGHDVSADDICKNLCKFCAGDVIQWL